MHKSKICICHYRVGKTDGVSLEIEKRKRLLSEMGHEVQLISGPRQNGADYIIDELEFNRPEILKIKENALFKFNDYARDQDLLNDIYRVADIIKQKFLQFHQKEQYDYLFLHNMFSHGRHIAAAKAFCEVALETDIKVRAINHDFYSVGSYAEIYHPQTPLIREYLATYVPPKTPKIKHVIINSINQQELKKKTGLNSLLIPDTFDFNQPDWKKDAYNADLLAQCGLREGDLLALQATRIVTRKGIELAIDFVKTLAEKLRELRGKKLYNGKILASDAKVILVFANYAEKDGLPYLEKLKQKIKQEGVETKFISEQVDSIRRKANGKKIYALWDAYVYADLVTFPSLWEGWGNQFIEAVFAKKPVVVFEYPVFKADIKKEGYDVISLGGQIAGKDKDGLVYISQEKINEAVKLAIKMLIDTETKQKLEKNFQIGKKYHSEETLKNLLRRLF